MDFDRELEEGEMSDETEMIVDGEEESAPIVTEDNKSTLFYKANKKGVIVEQLEKIDASKLEERAKRFGLDLTGSKLVTQQQIDDLYSNFGIESGNERHFRFDTLHLNGVNGLTTKEIFEYLEDYKPVSLEWIDSNSCNIVCQDHICVALALLVHSREITNYDVKKMLLDKSSYHWREGMPHAKNDIIFMRFATNSDKKVSTKLPEKKLIDSDDIDNGKNPWGDLCRSWGVYDHQEIFQRKLPKADYDDQLEEEEPKPIQLKNKKLAMRLGKRNHRVPSEEENSSGSDSEWKKKSKTPRMRMHADDEESKVNRHNINRIKEENEGFAPLSIEVVNSKSKFMPKETKIISDKFKYKVQTSSRPRTDIQSRLGQKISEDKSYLSEDGSSNDSDYNMQSRVEKVTKKSNSVWSRLEVDASKNPSQSDLRQILTTRKQKSDDLRGKLGKSKQCNLRIEIDNNYADE